MKHLTVIRHAKAADPAQYAEDIQRPLQEKGIKDTRAVARVLAAMEPPIDWWITSPAARARETVDLLLAEAANRVTVTTHEDAYPGAAEHWLRLIAEAPPEIEHVALVGHNPGLEELVGGLCAGDALHLNFRLTTAGVAHLELEVARWDQARWGCGQLRLLLTPKVLKK